MLLARMEMQGTHASTRKNLDIEVLRAVAVLMVLVDHIDFLIFWNGSIAGKVHVVTSLWGGVDLFFCISGFVITQLFLRQARGSSFIGFALPFWLRRVYRIWPSAIFTVLVVLAASLLFNRSSAFGDPKGDFLDAVSVVMQVANFHFYHCSTALGGYCGVNTVYWSLSLEEQFYLVFPFLFFFLSRSALKVVLICIIGLLFFTARQPQTFLWEIRVDALAWGALIALTQTSARERKLQPRFLSSKVRAVFTTVLLSGLIASLGTNMVILFQTGLIALLSAGLVWIASFDEQFTFPAGKLRNVLVWIGSRSYALYLVHPIAERLTHEIFSRLYPGQSFDDHFLFRFLLVGFGLTFVLAEANYRLLETPLRLRGVRLARNLKEHLKENAGETCGSSLQ